MIEAARSSSSRMAFGAFRSIETPPVFSGAHLCLPRSLTSIRAVASLAAAHLSENVRQRGGPTALALSDGLEEHSLGFRICLEGLISFEREDRHGRTFGQFRVHLDPTVDNPSWCDPHWGILKGDPQPAGPGSVQRSQAHCTAGWAADCREAV
jgi:hypothetical protein